MIRTHRASSLLVPTALAALVGLAGAMAGCAPREGRSTEGALAASSTRGGVREAGAADPLEVPVVAVRPSLGPEAMWETYLEPVTDVPVIARADGVAERVLVEEGRRVSRGQPIVLLESREQRLEVEYTGAIAAQAAAELARAEKGASGQWVSQQTLDVARAKARATKADLDLAQLALERRTLRAPVAGIVWQQRARPHRMVRAGEAIFRVTDPSRLRAELFLPPSAARGLRAGASVALDPTGDAAGSTIEARVETISPLADPATGRVRVLLVAKGSSPGLAGTTVRARIGASGGAAGAGAGAGGGAATSAGTPVSDGAVLPRAAALEREGDRLFVWRVRDGKAERALVELGASRSDGYEVLAGLSAGDLVWTGGTALPPAGVRVRPRLVGASD